MENRTEIHFVGKKWRGVGSRTNCLVLPTGAAYVLEIGARASSMLGARGHGERRVVLLPLLLYEAPAAGRTYCGKDVSLIAGIPLISAGRFFVSWRGRKMNCRQRLCYAFLVIECQ